CGMDRIMETAKNHGLAVIEDAAHALPAYYNGTCVGTIGDFTCFSFYATKPLSAGEGGMITTSDDGAAERCRRLRLHGISREAWNRYADGGSWRYDVTETGFKYNMTDIQAALGTVQLSRQNELRSRRARIAAMYDDAFGTNPGLIPHAHQPGSTSAHHLYVLRVNIEAGQTRDSLISHLASCGIGTSVHYIPLYRFTSFKDSGYTPEDFPNCEWLFERSLSLPVYPGLTDDEVRYVIDTVSAATGGGGGVS
ncbi:MAG: DegT/DnrJ/EryC1/StrS family aminotransferase, partial [Spirochaetota bacterium]